MGAALLEDIGVEALVLPAATPLLEIDGLFRTDRGLRAVAIEDAQGHSLLTRDQVEYAMSGPLGFGRDLNAKAQASDLPGQRFELPAELDLSGAVELILERPEEVRYQDFLVVAGGRPLIVPVSKVFAGLTDVFRHAAMHDPLTGLPNRRMLEEHAPVMTRNTDRSRIGILFIDLDDFKVVNDTFGHRAGDAVLTECAARLSSCARPSDMVVRLGGDEFAVLLVDVDESVVRDVAERILTAMDDPFIFDAYRVNATVTIGLAMASEIPDDDALTRLDALLRHADGAMFRAKHSGKARMGRMRGAPPVPLGRQSQIRRRLPLALDEGAMSLHYQPLLDMRSGALDSVEALIRWVDPEIGPISPDEFIPIAEDTGEIHRIGRWVADIACAQARQWLDDGAPRKIAINVSPRQLATGDVATEIRAALHRHGVPSRWLEVELTEGTAVVDVPGTARQLRELIDAGIGVALDDYGTGNSSLALIRKLPLTAVKIDRSLIADIDTDPFAAAIVGALVHALTTLGLRTTAEGIERHSQLEIVRAAGCDSAQGYLISRPWPPCDVPARFQDEREPQEKAWARPTMKFAEDLRVHACTELTAGDEIEAWRGGLPAHRGPVTELAPDAGVFWIMDHRGGGRKLLDLDNFVVIRVPLQPASPASPEAESKAA